MLEKIRYNPKASRYIDSNGRFVGQAKLDRLVLEEIQRTKARLRNVTQKLIDGKRSLSDWQETTALILKDSHLRLATLAAGGKGRLDKKQLGKVGAKLKSEYQLLNNFAKDIKDKEMSGKAILARAQLYAQSAAQTYYGNQHYIKGLDGANVAMRIPDPEANHCADCPGYSTHGLWLAINKVVPRGIACQCRGRCRCRVRYARRVNGVIYPL
jgi:hypothetical protein